MAWVISPRLAPLPPAIPTSDFDNSSNYFTMKENYLPGDLGFAVPRSFLDKDEEFMLNAEVNNGRLAMIGSLGMITQELVSNAPIF